MRAACGILVSLVFWIVSSNDRKLTSTIRTSNQGLSTTICFPGFLFPDFISRVLFPTCLFQRQTSTSLPRSWHGPGTELTLNYRRARGVSERSCGAEKEVCYLPVWFQGNSISTASSESFFPKFRVVTRIEITRIENGIRHPSGNVLVTALRTAIRIAISSVRNVLSLSQIARL